MKYEDIYLVLQDYLVEMFEIPKERISPDARLYEDLGLDSIDAIDLVVKLQKITKRKFKPEDFKSVRTMGDVVSRTFDLLHDSGRHG
ncbi:MAG: acyl carrier protein [Magnetococcales bacterium]|nr:acyl carrier protein [Magnetococcales bacterium]